MYFRCLSKWHCMLAFVYAGFLHYYCCVVVVVINSLFHIRRSCLLLEMTFVSRDTQKHTHALSQPSIAFILRLIFFGLCHVYG